MGRIVDFNALLVERGQRAAPIASAEEGAKVMLDHLHDLHRFAEVSGLPGVALSLEVAADAVLSELRRMSARR